MTIFVDSGVPAAADRSTSANAHGRSAVYPSFVLSDRSTSAAADTESVVYPSFVVKRAYLIHGVWGKQGKGTRRVGWELPPSCEGVEAAIILAS